MEIKIKDNLVTYIESLQYEKNRTKEIVSFMIDHNYDITTETFKKWDKENQICYYNYEKAKALLESEYIYNIKEFKGKKIKWNLNFETKLLTCEVE